MSDLLNNFYVYIERRQLEDRTREETESSIIRQITEEFRRIRKTHKQQNDEE